MCVCWGGWSIWPLGHVLLSVFTTSCEWRPFGILATLQVLTVIVEPWLLIVKYDYLVPVTLRLKSCMNLNHWFNDCLYYSQPQPSEKSHHEILSVVHAPLTNVLLMTWDVALVSRISTENILLASQCVHLSISCSHFPWPLARATQVSVLFLASSEASLKLPIATLAVSVSLRDAWQGVQ